MKKLSHKSTLQTTVMPGRICFNFFEEEGYALNLNNLLQCFKLNSTF